MTLTDAEQRFLARQPRGYLATIGPDGTPQVKPLGFTYNAALGTIDIDGYNMARSAKYRNIQANPRVAFVVDEVTEASMEGAHFLEIRGTAEAITPAGETGGAEEVPVIRITPTRVLSFGIEEPPGEPHRTRLRARDLP